MKAPDHLWLNPGKPFCKNAELYHFLKA